MNENGKREITTMAERRKDQKGRVLRYGESYRKTDGLYTFRYQDKLGRVKAIYASDLAELRKKEEPILSFLNEDVNYAAGGITVIELVERYISLKEGVRYNTKVGYNFVLNLIKKEDFGYRSIRDILPSEAQRWFIKLHKDGRGYSTLTSVRGVLKPAFQMAYEEDIVRKNPFDFVITKYVPNDSKHRNALSETDLETWMNFIRNDKAYCKYYDEFIVLLGTGMRVSEFCGLTRDDLDFQNRTIRVDHQLVRDAHCNYYIEKTKTESGRRFIPMTNEVYDALKNILRNCPRRRKSIEVDGYKDFILIDKKGCPKVALHIQNEIRWARAKYMKKHPDAPLPNITPHVFRHTFCTNMALAGMDVKVLQYLMGHSDIEVTMNVYTHMTYDKAATQMLKLVDGAAFVKDERKTISNWA